MKKLAFILFTIAIFYSCEKEKSQIHFEITDISYSDGKITINWSPISLNNFSHYKVLRSDNGQYFEEINQADFYSTIISKTSYSDSTFATKDVLYYKIVAYGDETAVTEKQMFVFPELARLPFNPDEAYFMPENKQILFFENSLNQSYLYLYNYISNQVVNSKNIEINGSGLAYGFGKTNNNYEFYYTNGGVDDPLKIIDVQSLEEVASIPSTYGCDKSIVSNNKNHIFLTNLSELYSINRNTLESTTFTNQNFHYFERKMYSEGLNSIFGSNPTFPLVSRLQLGDNGEIVSNTYKRFDTDREISFIPNSNHAIFYKKEIYGIEDYYYSHHIINLGNWETETLRNKTSDVFTFSALCKKDDVLYAVIEYEFSQMQGVNFIYCYSMETLELIETIRTRLKPGFIFIDDENKLIIIEKSMQSYVCKIELIDLND